jgi:hypothetical protein
MAPAWKVGWVQALMGSNPIFSAVKKPQSNLGLFVLKLLSEQSRMERAEHKVSEVSFKARDMNKIVRFERRESVHH